MPAPCIFPLARTIGPVSLLWHGSSCNFKGNRWSFFKQYGELDERLLIGKHDQKDSRHFGRQLLLFQVRLWPRTISILFFSQKPKDQEKYFLRTITKNLIHYSLISKLYTIFVKRLELHKKKNLGIWEIFNNNSFFM